MGTDQANYVEKWLAHVRALAHDIGPRGSTTEGERQGSLYCSQALSDLGLAPEIESFQSARSIFFPHLLTSLGMLAAFALYPFAGRTSAIVAALLSLVAVASDLMELSFIPNLVRWLTPKGPSQNVVATVPPAEEHRQDLVLIGHVDSQRTPIVFSSVRWLATYQAFTTVAFVLFVVQVLLYILGAITLWNWVWLVSIPSAVGALLLAAMCIQADQTPFTAGANDNATAAGLVLTLGEQLLETPLKHTRVWLVCTGCEEVQHYGAADFFRRHGDELVNASSVVFEMLGCDGPAWLTQEGIVIPFRADPRMRAVVERLAAEHPEWGAHPVQIKGGNTEMADALRAGLPAITLTGQGPNGEMPYWHQVEDTVDKIDPQVLSRTYAFVWSYLQALDAER